MYSHMIVAIIVDTYTWRSKAGAANGKATCTRSLAILHDCMPAIEKMIFYLRRVIKPSAALAIIAYMRGVEHAFHVVGRH